jgi:hypothetical protein
LVVDSVALEKGAKLANLAAGDVTDAASRVLSSVQQAGNAPWGDDPGLGQTFASVFAEPRQALVETMQKLPEVLTQLVDDLTRAQHNFVNIEDTNVLVAQQLKRPM